MKFFNHWKRQEEEEVFGLNEVKVHPLLENWLKAKCDYSELEKQQLINLQTLLKDNVDLWNEMELKVRFLGPLLTLVNYDTDDYKFFMERPLIAKKGDKTASGTVDFLIAKGRQLPRSPFFSVHEYKAN